MGATLFKIKPKNNKFMTLFESRTMKSKKNCMKNVKVIKLGYG
jgi:hypothetical protein